MATIAQPSAIRSAETLAALRALAAGDKALQVPCNDPFAHHFLAPSSRALSRFVPRAIMKSILGRVAPGGYCYAIARTRHFDEALMAAVKDGAEQVVLLGAGYDSRPLRFARQLERARVFEVDHPGTQARKKQILADKVGPLPANVTLVSCDFTRQSLKTELARAGFDSARRTIFLWEGVSYYLPLEAVADVLAFVAGCAPGSAIVFDYALRSFVDGDTSTYGGRQVARWLKDIGEPFLFGLDAGETSAFLTRHGLAAISDLGPVDLERRYLTTTRNESLGRTLGHVRIVTAEVPNMQTPEVRS